MRRLGHLVSMPAAERRVLAEALLLLGLAAASLKVLGLRRTRAILARWVPGGPASSLDAAAVARMVKAAARHGPVRAKCLSAAVTLESLLRRHGMEGELRLGVRKHRGRFEAHAWVEHRAVALMESPEIHSRYAAFGESLAPRP